MRLTGEPSGVGIFQPIPRMLKLFFMNLDTTLEDTTMSRIQKDIKDMQSATLLMSEEANLVQLWEAITSTIIQIQESTILNWGSLLVVTTHMTWPDISPSKDSHLTEELSPEHATPAMPIQVRG